MTFRSRLFATVALPVLSTALIATPTLADALMRPFEVAQESTGEGQPSEEELLLQQQRPQDESQRAAEEEQQRQADEQKAAEEAERAAAEQQAAEDEAQRAAEEEQQRQADEQKAADEAEKAAAEQKAADEEAARAAADEQKAAEEAQKAASEQKAAEDEAARAAAEEQQRQAEEREAAAEAEKAAAGQKAAEDEAQRSADGAEQQRQADEQKAAEEQNAQDEQKPVDEEQADQPAQQQEGGTSETTAGEQPTTSDGEEPAVAGEDTPTDTGMDQPATADTGETPAAEPVPEIVDTMTEEEKREIAEDPARTDETVVLPVDNGAAVLDSDKDADNAGGQESRDERRKKREELRAQEEEAPVPDTDDAAQATISEEMREAVPGRIEAAIKEEGERVKAAPDFAVPETTNIINNTVINNTVINNNTTIDNSATEVNIVERFENRTVLEVGDRLIVRGDDRPRLRRDSEEVYYDNLARGRVRETIVRPGGVEIVTIYNRYGDIIQRSRVGRDGRENILVYAPELEDDSPRPGLVDVGYELPPMRLRIPVSDYIIDTSSNPDRD